MPNDPTNETTPDKLPTLEDLHEMGINITNGEDSADYIQRLRSGDYEVPAPAPPPAPPATLRVTDERAADIQNEIENRRLALPWVADLLADRATMVEELARLRSELTELTSEPRKKWDRKESFGYQDGREDARDMMGQQVMKILEGATAKEVQEWLKR